MHKLMMLRLSIRAVGTRQVMALSSICTAVHVVSSCRFSTAEKDFERATELLDGARPDVPAARLLLESSARGAHAGAQGRLGRWMLWGLYGVARDVRGGLALLLAAARAGDVDAAYWLGVASLRVDEFVAAAAPGCGGDGSNNVGIAASLPDPTKPETEAAHALRSAAAGAVIADLKLLRRAAARARNEKMGGGGRRGGGGVTADTVGEDTASDAAKDHNILWDEEDPEMMPLAVSTARAAFWMRRAAEAGHTDAAVALGNLLMRGAAKDAHYAPRTPCELARQEKTVLPQTAEAIEWYQRAAGDGENNFISSSSSHVFSHTAGDARSGIPIAKALIGKRSPKQEHPDALFNLGMIFWEGLPTATPPIAADPARALVYFERAGAARDSSALFFLGSLLVEGSTRAGINSSPARGVQLIERAATLHHGGAAHYLWLYWREKRDFARAGHFLELAALGGEHAEALSDLGAARFAGTDGFAIDLPGALEAFERAADAGATAPGTADDSRVAALLSAGAMYARGLGTQVNYRAALVRYQAAAELNSIEAWENIAAMHAQGQGVPKDGKQARGIMDMAARLRAEVDKLTR